MADAPKYCGKLSRNSVKNFLTNLSLWGGSRNLNDQRLKFQLPLCFVDQDASRWFSTQMDLVYDDTVSYERLCKIFLEEAPFVFENNSTLADLQSEKQRHNESTSSYILRVLSEAGETLYDATQQSWVEAFLRNMAQKVSDYVDNRGRPANIAQLKILVREYERHKDSRPLASESSHQAGMESTITDIKVTLGMICQELAEIKQGASVARNHVTLESSTNSEGDNEYPGYGQHFEPVNGNINQIKSRHVNKHSPLIVVSINEHKQEALIDSGAYCSLVGFSIAKWFPRIQSPKINISSVTNFPIQNFGVALIPIKIGHTVITFPLVVVEDTTANLVLGSDFMKALRVDLNIAAGTVESPIFGTVQILAPQSNFLQMMNIEHLVKIEACNGSNLPISHSYKEGPQQVMPAPKQIWPPTGRVVTQNTRLQSQLLTYRQAKNVRFKRFYQPKINWFQQQNTKRFHPFHSDPETTIPYYSEQYHEQKLQPNLPFRYQS